MRWGNGTVYIDGRCEIVFFRVGVVLARANLLGCCQHYSVVNACDFKELVVS